MLKKLIQFWPWSKKRRCSPEDETASVTSHALLRFGRSRGLARLVVVHTRDPRMRRNDRLYFFLRFGRETNPFAGHEIDGLDSTHDDWMRIHASISLHSDGLGAADADHILRNRSIEPAAYEDFVHARLSPLPELEVLLGRRNTIDSKEATGTREGLPFCDALGKIEFPRERTNLVLEEAIELMHLP